MVLFSFWEGLETGELSKWLCPTIHGSKRSRGVLLRGNLKISEQIFHKITVPYDFQSKFLDFWLNGKHPWKKGKRLSGGRKGTFSLFLFPDSKLAKGLKFLSE